MSTQTKLFLFTANAEGWTGNATEGIGLEYKKRSSGRGKVAHRTDHPGSGEGSGIWYGTLAAHGKNGAHGSAVSTSPSWEWKGIWEDLGVPFGSKVTSVTASFYGRWYMHKRGKLSALYFNASETGIGPLQLVKGTSTTDLVAVQHPTRARTSGNAWKNEPSILTLGDPASGWKHAVGSAISVPSAAQYSDRKIHLKLNMLIPATLGEIIQLKATRIKLVMTYSAVPKTYAPFFGI
jgi:hypothetical protein